MNILDSTPPKPLTSRELENQHKEQEEFQKKKQWVHECKNDKDHDYQENK